MKQTLANPHLAQDLHSAFNTFNQLSAQLTESYQHLESRVAGLTEALALEQDERIRELKEKERLAQRLQSLLNALPGGVVVVDGQGRVQEHNPVALGILGQPLLGEKWSDIIQRAFAPRSDDGHDVSLVDGRKVNISTCPLGNEPGQILLITDVTEIRELQDRLGQQQRLAAMGKMAATLAHQIRTPLSSALLYISNLKRPQLEEQDRLVLVDKLTQRLRHLEQLIEDMLLYSRGGNPGEEQFTTQALLQELALNIEEQVKKTATAWRVSNQAPETSLKGNRQMLASAITNLAMNAMQAMGNGGQLHTWIRQQGTSLEIAINDNGPGISAENQQQIFNPFFTTRTQGTGLGLAVVKAIATAHGGRVELDSQPGKGSTFKIIIPLAEPAQQTGKHDIQQQIA